MGRAVDEAFAEIRADVVWQGAGAAAERADVFPLGAPVVHRDGSDVISAQSAR
jgi:hypothetical protein